ncbi:hypothetical protein [Dyella sp. C11]|uniref:hypothetical protein n=1 Tax=Dyella sp. C11 TaxID=2126991 RepID=UPI000D64D09F|nr:hypothetical protein [Dyella sp. C11]
MSFDLYLQRFDAGNSAQVDRTRVLSVLRAVCQDQPDGFGLYSVGFPDGSALELSAEGLESEHDFTGCVLHLREFTGATIDFVFNVAALGDMVIFNAQGRDTPKEPLVILTAPAQQQHLPDEVGDHPVVCTSPAHLAQLLGVAIEGWEGFRDAVLAGNSGRE